MINFNDKQLISLAIEPNQLALEVLIKRYLRRVYAFVYNYVHSREEAEDITQEVFIKVWRNLKKFDNEKPFKPWLYQIAKNTALDFLKKKSAVPFSAFETKEGVNYLEKNVVDNSTQLEEKVDTVLSFSKSYLAIQRLAPIYADVVKMRHGQDMNFRQISEAVNVSLNTIKSRYRRAMLLLKGMLRS